MCEREKEQGEEDRGAREKECIEERREERDT